MKRLDVMCVTPSSAGGWGPVTDLAALAGRLFGTTPTYVRSAQLHGYPTKLASLLPRTRSEDRALLLIASRPGDLLALAAPEVLLGRYGHVTAWIFDSFWDDHIPYFARHRHGIDSVWITDAELVDRYSDAMHHEVGWLPWGTDAVAAHAIAHDDERPTDVMRLGRQPQAWDDDEANSRLLARNGLTYSGRFPDEASGSETQATVRRLLSEAKVVLASGNLASPAPYTHPTREYISARFTDAAAAGARIAGQRPHCAAADLLPADIWIDMDTTNPETGAATLLEAVQSHSCDGARALRREALLSLDWRHRLRQVADATGVAAPALRAELRLLEKLAGELA